MTTAGQCSSRRRANDDHRGQQWRRVAAGKQRQRRPGGAWLGATAAYQAAASRHACMQAGSVCVPSKAVIHKHFLIMLWAKSDLQHQG